jgi:hypothetical protein
MRTRVPRAAILPALGVLVGALLAPACSAPRKHKARAPGTMPVASASGRSREVTLATANEVQPSELTSVTDDHPDPEAMREFQARLGQAAIPLVATKAPQRVTAIALEETRMGEAPNMAPAGDVYTATLKEGQRATLTMSIAPTECLALIAQGGLGVVEVDLFLTSNETATGKVLAEDTSVGPIAVIGGRGKCVTGAKGTGTDVVLNVAVRRGAGLVLVRAYKKG